MIKYNFTIIIPFKKGISFLKQCINGVLNQTYPHFNIIVLVDCESNSDGSIDFLNSLCLENMQIVQSEFPLNIYQNWDRIKDLNVHEFSTILGYDDILEPFFLETINNLINQFPNNHLYHTHFNYIDANNQFLKNCFSLPESLDYLTYTKLFLENKISIMATGYVFNSNAYKSIGGININYANLIYADVELWLELIGDKKLIVSPLIAFKFRTHQNTTQISNSDVFLNALLCLINYFENKNKQYNLNDVFKVYGNYFFIHSIQQLSHKYIHFSFKEKNAKNVLFIANTIKMAALKFNVHIYPFYNWKILAAFFLDKLPFFKQIFIKYRMKRNKPFFK